MKSVDTISVSELTKMAENMFGSLVKAVVDVDRNLLVVDAELHADQEQFLLEDGSKQTSLWGINLYPAKFGTDEFIEFDSMINIRPRQNNRSRDIEDNGVKDKITDIVSQKVIP
ncbi:MAG: DUF5674 family protein [Candidatus Saccharimonadales bacterium]